MNLRRYLPQQCVELEFNLHLEREEEEPEHRFLWRKKELILQRIVELLDASGNVRNANKLFRDLYNREKKATTALEKGFALPHVRTENVKKLTMALLICPDGVELDALDGEPSKLFWAMVAPPYDDVLYLRIYKNIAKGIHQGLMESLLSATNKNEIYQALNTNGLAALS
ncbi:MAG: PTS sugar transporter subunit IIA [Planctomycetota bacterium]|nr:MAG: PTS sugar transporter subunit IIA [Planctomycetota bacterium]